MAQTRIDSLVEVLLNVAIGWVIALVTQLLVFPMFGINISIGDQLGISVIFTVVSIVRGYVIRRWFNARLHAMAMKLAKELDV